MKEKVLKRALCIMLCVIMCVGLMPVSSMKVQAAEYTLTPLPSNISNKIIKPVPGLTAEQAIEICKDSSYSVVIYKIEEGMVYSVLKWNSEWINNRTQSLSSLSSEGLSGFAVIGTVEDHEHVWTYETESEDTFVCYCENSACSLYSQDFPITLTLCVPDVVLAGTNAPAYYNPSAQLTWENITGNSAPDIKYYADASLSTPVEDITAEKGGTYYAAAKIAGTEVVAKTKFTIAYVVDNLVAGEPVSGEKLSTPNINEWSGYETPDAFWKNAFITNANSDLSAKCHWIYRPYGELNGKKIDDVTFNTYGKSELTIDESWSGGSIYVEMDFGNGIVLCSKPMNIKTEPFKISWKEDSFVGKWNTYPGATQYWVVLYKNNSAIIDRYKTTRPGNVGNVKEYDFESMIIAQGTGKYKFSVSPFVSNSYIDTGMKSSEIIYCSSHTYGEYMVDDEGKHYQKCTFCNRESEHEAHSGGIADCKNKAVCEVCSIEYGEVDLTKHDYSESVPNGDGTFKIVCKICGKDYEPVNTVDGLLEGSGLIGDTLTTDVSYSDVIIEEYVDTNLKPNDPDADPLQYAKFYYIPKDSDEAVLIDSSKVVASEDSQTYELVIEEEWAGGEIYVKYENLDGQTYVSNTVQIYSYKREIKVNGLEYTFDFEDGELFATLSGPSDLSGDIVIPEKVNNNGTEVPVTVIKDKLFMNNQNITSVKMPDTVKKIGPMAFLSCKNLKSLVLSNNIDASEFYLACSVGSLGMINYCERLETINIPATVEVIPSDYLWGLGALKQIIIPASIKSIDKNTFENVLTLEEVIYLGTEEEWNTLINENCGEGNNVLKTVKVVCHIHSGGTATCTKKAVCEDCGDEYGELAEHDFSESSYYPTEDKTKHYQKCKDCVATSTPVAHTETEIKNKKDATCTEKGYSGDKCCKDCGILIEVGTEVNAKGHTEVVLPAKEATCKETGLTEGKKCSVCGTVTVAQTEVKKLEHTWDEGKVTKEPTKDAEGIKTFTCIKCSETKTEAIDKLPDDQAPTPDPAPTPGSDPEPVKPLIPEISVKGKFDVAAAVATVSDKKPLAYAITSSDKKAGKITKAGILTAKKAGEVEITAYSDKKKTEEISKVKVVIKSTKVPKKDTIRYMDETYDLKSKITDMPLGVDVKFSISEKQQKFATVDAKTGIITPVKDGKVKVTVEIGEGNNAAKFYTTVTIKTPQINPAKAVVIAKDKAKAISLKNVKSSDKIEWSVSDATKAEIIKGSKDSKIKLKGLEVGKVTLTADVNGHKISKEIEIK